MGRSEQHAEVPKVGRLRRLMQKIWCLHSFFALSFGVMVMAFARKGLAHADKVLIALVASWIVVFIAFRFIVGPANRSDNEFFVKKGVRLVTNYVIKQMYQQMFFFLVPLYASSATWTMQSTNWWIVPLLLLCAVLSTMDLVFDNFIMEHRNIAAGMYGLCMFAVLNLLLQLSFHVPHFGALMVAAAITPLAVALLSYPLASVFGARGLALVGICTAGLVAGCYLGRATIPPAPMAMAAGGIGHGTQGSYECVPGPVRTIKATQLDKLRCVSEVAEPGGIKDSLVHVWKHKGVQLLRVTPDKVHRCPQTVLISEPDPELLPKDPTGAWSCAVETTDGQLVGLMSFDVPKAKSKKKQPVKPAPPDKPAQPEKPARPSSP